MTEITIPPHIIPIYAEEVKVNAGIKMHVTKNEAGKDEVRKDARVELLFFDNATKCVVSRIVMDVTTALQMVNILQANTQALLKECASKEIPKEIAEHIKKQQQTPTSTTGTPQRYIG